MKRFLWISALLIAIAGNSAAALQATQPGLNNKKTTSQGDSAKRSADKTYSLLLAPADGQVVYLKSVKVLSDLNETESFLFKENYHIKNKHIISIVQVKKFDLTGLSIDQMQADEQAQALQRIDKLAKEMVGSELLVIEDKYGKELYHHFSGSSEFKSFAESYLDFNQSPFPHHPVRVGDTWSFSLKDNDEPRIVYTLTNVNSVNGHDIADISSWNSQDHSQGSGISMRTTSQLKIDLTTGLLTEGTMNESFMINGQKGLSVSFSLQVVNPPASQPTTNASHH